MQVLSAIEAAETLSKASGKWVLYISFCVDEETWIKTDLFEAAPYLNFREHLQILADGQGFIVCDSQEECEALFQQTVGDDGPTDANPYDGPMRVYALTISPTRGLCNENT